MTHSVQTRLLSMQETLRTIGNELERRHVQQVQIVVDAAGVTVDSRDQQDAYRRYSWADMAAQSRLQLAQRQSPQQLLPCMDPWALTRWPVLLRVTGQLLDKQGIESYTVEAVLGVTTETITLRVLVAGEEVFRRTGVGVEVWQLRSQAPSRTAAEATPRERSWWARWRGN
jgi:hypothetical protein